MSSSTSNRTISRDSIVTAAKDMVTAELAGEAVILNLESGIYYGLNAVGTRIWELVQEADSVEAIQNTILAEYDVEEAQCEHDTITLLQDMVAKGLIDIKEHPGA